MATRKIDDDNGWSGKEWVPDPCNNHEHNPPSMMVFEPGTYEHECPGCGAKQVFVVRQNYTF